MWILCSNESTVDIIKNSDIITNTRKTQKPIELTGIGGEPMKVTLERTVYYHPEVEANILSFYKLTKRFKSVIYNSEKKGYEMEFIPSKDGLYQYDFNLSIRRRTALEKMNTNNMSMNKGLIIKTVEDIKRNFTKRVTRSKESYNHESYRSSTKHVQEQRA
jgi:hypothetical protein